MKRLRSFILTSLLGGILVILPATIVGAIFLWIFHLTANLMSPIALLLSANTSLPAWTADMIAVVTLVIICFFLGIFVRTKLGALTYKFIENNIFYNFPGYKLVKEAIGQFVGGPHAQFSRVALVRIYDSPSLTTAFITATHRDGSYTVFVPTAPNPISGLIYHLPADRVTMVDISVERAMRTVLACGAGSQVIVEKNLR